MQRRAFFLAALITFAALITSAHAQSNCPPQDRKELILTALDKDGNVLDKLRREHLSLKLGNAPATILNVAFHADQPLDIAVMIDSSLSQERVLPLSKAAAQTFIKSFATAGRDRVATVSFSTKANNNPEWSSDFAAAVASIDQIKLDIPPGYVGGGAMISVGPPPRNRVLPGSTSLWDVVRTAIQTLFAGNAENRRRVILLFTDGNDTASSGKLNGAIEEAVQDDVAVFSVGLDSDFGLNEGALKKLSEQTGGVTSRAKKKEQLETALAEIAKRLRGSYVISYCGGLNTKGKLQVEVLDPEIRKAKPVLAYKKQ